MAAGGIFVVPASLPRQEAYERGRVSCPAGGGGPRHPSVLTSPSPTVPPDHYRRGRSIARKRRRGACVRPKTTGERRRSRARLGDGAGRRGPYHLASGSGNLG